MNQDTSFDLKEYEVLLQQASQVANTYKANRVSGLYAWNDDTIESFKREDLETLICDPYFLNMKNEIRPVILEDIFELWEERKKRKIHVVCFEEGIGSGKTTKASIILWLQWFELCLHESPQKYFGIPVGSNITFVCSSRTETQAKRIAFSKVWARFLSQFNKDYFPPNPRYKSEIQIARNNTYIYAGNSSALSVQGYDYFGGMMDECNSMETVSDSKRAVGDAVIYDEADELESNILLRMTSRFIDEAGMLICMSSTTHKEDFLRRKLKEHLSMGDESNIFYKKRRTSESFYMSNKEPFKKYNANVSRKINPKKGVFYIDLDTGKEVAPIVARTYFNLLIALLDYRNFVLFKWRYPEDYIEKLRGIDREVGN